MQDKDLKPEIREITDQYSDVFKGIGKIRDIKNGKEFYANFSMRPEAVPVAQRPRPGAYYLQEPLKKWPDQFVEEEIFEEVPEGEAVTWCSPPVVQPKPKFNTVDKEKLEPHMIRASVDLRVPNQFMERNRITQGPIVEDFMYKFLNQRDDILLGGRNMEEHNKTLETVLQRVVDFGITFNPDKGQFRVEEIEFYGQKFTKDGLKPDPEKMRAVKESSPPESKLLTFKLKLTAEPIAMA